jgi:hypothetical protein
VGREIAWNTGPVNEYKTQSATIPFICLIIRKEYELQLQYYFIFISWLVATPKES